MRKLLIATITAMVLFAVGAFAASFALQAEDVASGSDKVQDCANSTLDFTLGTYNSAKVDWPVASGTLSGCTGYTGGEVVLLDGANAKLESGTLTAGGTVTFAGTTYVRDVKGAAVLVDGRQLATVALP